MAARICKAHHASADFSARSTAATLTVRATLKSAPLAVGLSILLAACSSDSSGTSNGGGGGANGGGDSQEGGAASNNEDGGNGSALDGGSENPNDAGNPASDSGGVPSSLTPGTSMISMMVAGQNRSAVLYVPQSASNASPLVLAMHGNGDTDTNFLATSGLQPLADKDAFVIVAPQGITRDVMVMGQTVPQVDWDAYNTSNNIDTAFVDALRTKLQATNQVSTKKTFIFGYSQGGYFAFLYGLSEAANLSCTAVLAASSPFGGGSNDSLITGASRKIPVVLQIGTLDSAYSAAMTTDTSLKAATFPVQFNAIAGAGHVPIPGDVSVPLAYCLGQSL